MASPNIEVLKYNFRIKTAQAKVDEHNQAKRES